mmetsp:Transcript_7197/g.28311  ORF Transcript_7197/g.28311 Transcript_7197/m.28311 type:complete len:258 (-) Transcript_7197:575-1348(-)
MHRGSPSGDQSMTRTRNGNVRPSPAGGAASDGPPSFATPPTGDPNPPPSPSTPPELREGWRLSGDGSGNTTRTFHSGAVVLIRVAVLRVTPPYVSSQYGLLVRDSLFVAGSLCAPATSTTSAPPGPDAAAIAPSSDRRYAFSKSYVYLFGSTYEVANTSAIFADTHSCTPGRSLTANPAGLMATWISGLLSNEMSTPLTPGDLFASRNPTRSLPVMLRSVTDTGTDIRGRYGDGLTPALSTMSEDTVCHVRSNSKWR